QSDLIVRSGGVVYIEPGCEIKFLPDTSIQVLGGSFMAYGQKNKEIRLVPASENAPSGSFIGLILDNAQKAILTRLIIQKAETGIRIKGCAPRITETKITKCAQAAIYLEDRAAPEISCSEIYDNQGMGGLLLEGEGLAPKIHNNIFINNEPFQVQSYTPLTIDLSNNYWGTQKINKELFLGESIILDPILKKKPECLSGF
ncbi:right-handed parallel beta-helix repeat-containing protein, partial [Desulfovulcanus sp.]